MRRARRYCITIEDEAHLRQVAKRRISTLGLWFLGIALAAGGIAIAGAIIAFSPLRSMLPGYMKEAQREASEEALLRLDSLMQGYATNQAYIDNVLRIMDIDYVPHDSAAIVPISRELVPDSLMSPGERERSFVSQMEEKEKFNISVLAPLAAEGMLFSPVMSEGVFTSDSKTAEEGEILLTSDSAILASADGSVVALYYSGAEGGYVLVLQHSRGFLTSYFGAGTPLVGVGDIVNSGQSIALAGRPDSKGVRRMHIRMWHNGLPVVPYEYVSLPERRVPGRAAGYEAPRGK